MSDLKDAEVAIRSLLARIHGDGGHYTNEHGLEKSARDAEEIIIQFQAGPVAALNAAQNVACRFTLTG